MSDSGHGSVGMRQQAFTSIMDLRQTPGYDPKLLAKLAEDMKGAVDTVNDGPDPEENLYVPAGYTYFGQFVDHDLTFDSTSSLNPKDVQDSLPGTFDPTNLRSPRFDLDNVYGDGPAAQPFMYAADGATLMFGGTGAVQQRVTLTGQVVSGTTEWDLLRAPNGRAIIGDKRNDENSIVCQIQLGFIKFHNKVVAAFKNIEPANLPVPNDLFQSARNEVTWTYQRLVLEDFLPRIVRAEVFADLKNLTPEARDEKYAFYTSGKRSNLPREFVVAAYRFGHSGVRTGYRLNGQAGSVGGTKLSIFPASNQTDVSNDSLLGFDPLPAHHVIDDWRRFFTAMPPLMITDEDRSKPQRDDGVVRLQFAYKLDPTIVDPLGVLPISVAGQGTTDQAKADIKPMHLPDPQRPSLALLNLLRGNDYLIQGGQELHKKLQQTIPAAVPLAANYLCIRKEVPGSKGNRFMFEPIHPDLQKDTPLWFYILAEAQQSVVDAIPIAQRQNFDQDLLLTGGGATTQLGWVGGRIVSEVFYGLMDSDKDSIFRAGSSWQSILGNKSPRTLLELLELSRAP